MELTSPAFAAGALLPAAYTCDGKNVNPPLHIQFVPMAAQSLVLIVDDPDAPGGTWLHWSVWDIPPTTTDIPAGVVPPGAREGTTSFGTVGYGGPCPPGGTHRYVFKLFVLDKVLELENGATLTELQEAMDGHVIAHAELVGQYTRG